MLKVFDHRINASGANPFEPAARANYLLSQPPPAGLRERLSYNLELAQYLLQDGRTEDSIRFIKETIDLVNANLDRLEAKTITNLRSLLGVAYLRLGEQQNCVEGHTVESCLFPIKGSGVHQNQAGSRAAMAEFAAVLETEPGDLGARWLYNIAAMTVGSHPDGVPEKWRFPPDRFQSQFDIKRFRDVAPALGLDVLSLSGGAVMEDFDNDGFQDILCSSWSLKDQIRLFGNNGDGTFSDRTDEAGLRGITGGLNLVHADYDNDGFADVFVLRGGWKGKLGRQPNSLLKNNGDGTFTDTTEAAGLLTFHPSQTAAWGDYDNDGWVDLFIGNESYGSDSNPCQLFRNNRDGSFSDVASRAGVAAVAYVKGAVWGDYNNDGRIDLYLSTLLEANLLFRNVGPGSSGQWTFEEVGAKAGVTGPTHSFPAFFFDYNNDGWLDLFASGYGADYKSLKVDPVAAEYLGQPTTMERPRLYRNNRDGTFADMTKAAGLDRVLLAMGANYGDLDNDGYLDFYLATGAPDYRVLIPNVMFRNRGGQAFEDVSTAGGFGHLQKGHGVSFGDIDNDGDQDVYVEIGGAYTGDAAYNVLFWNPGHGNHWVTLRLEGVKSNRAGIGARIEVALEHPSGARSVHLVAGTGGSFGASTLQQEVGLGKATRIRHIQIQWPSGVRQRLSGVEMDRVLRVREAEAQARVEPLKKIVFKAAAEAQHQHRH